MKTKHIEVEQKYRLKSPAKMRLLIRRLGGKKNASGLETNELFDKSKELRSKNSILRLRRHDKRSVLTFKGPRLKSALKKRVEIEQEVDYDVMRVMLQALGYRKVATYRKRREEYLLFGCHVTLDQLTRIGWFLEIEGKPLSIRRLESRLGLEQESVEHRTYLELLGKTP